MRHYRTSLPAYLIIVNKERKKIHEHILFVPNWNSVYYVECVSAFAFPSKNRNSHAKRYVARRIMSFIWLFTRFISNISRKQMRIWIYMCAVRTFIFSTKSNGVSEWENVCEFENFGKSICTMNSNVFFIQIKYSNMVNKFTQNPKHFNA